MKAFCAVSGSPLTHCLEGHRADVTAITFHPAHPEGKVLLTGSLDGTLRTWNTNDFSLNTLFIAPGPVESLVISPPDGARQHDLAFLTCSRRCTDRGFVDGSHVYAYSLSTGRIVERLAKMSSIPTLVTSSCGDVFGVFERNTILIWSSNCRKNSIAKTRVRLHHTKQFTALALHHTSRFVAAGDVTGRILLWYNVLAGMCEDGQKRRFQSITTQSSLSGSKFDVLECSPNCTFHWHSQPVKCLLFSADGMHLVSGGAESVMVVWKLDEARKSYLPRLGAPLSKIFHFPRDASRVVVACVDNSLRVVSLSSLATECTIQGIRPSSSDYGMYNAKAVLSTSRDPKICSSIESRLHSFSKADTPTCLAIDPTSGALASSAAGAKVQLFDFTQDSHISDVHVSSNDHTSHADMIGGLEEIVTQLVFSPDGFSLATVSRRSEGASSRLDKLARARRAQCFSSCTEYICTETLKIWERHENIPSNDSPAHEKRHVRFTCVTTCDAPHKCNVTSVAFRSNVPKVETLLCTVSMDGEIKLWKRSVFSSNNEILAWSCCSAMFHADQQFTSIFSASFSSDGSLLATGSYDIVLWGPDSCVRLCGLKNPFRSSKTDRRIFPSASNEPSSHAAQLDIKFITGEPLLVTLQARRVVIWNLVTAAVVRNLCLSGVTITAHPSRHTFYVSIQTGEPSLAEGAFSTGNSGPSQIGELGIYILELGGPTLQATRCWESMFGKPKAVLVPRDESMCRITIVTENRLVVTVKKDCDTRGEEADGQAVQENSHAKFENGQELVPERDDNFTIASHPLKCYFGGTPLPSASQSFAASVPSAQAQAAKRIGENAFSTRASTTPYDQKRDGIGATSEISSHKLPQLTTLAPRFLDNLLARKSYC